jgi:hypothetical protein
LRLKNPSFHKTNLRLQNQPALTGQAVKSYAEALEQARIWSLSHPIIFDL